MARSSYHAWRAGQPARGRRPSADAAVTERIRAPHKADPTMGSPRITADLNEGSPQSCVRVERKRVARLMRAAGITGYRRRRRVSTTVPDQASDRGPDLLKRDFTAPAPNRRHVGDTTYLPLADGTSLYLATVIDCARPAPGRLGAARPHANACGHRGAPAGRGYSREPEGRRPPHRPRIGLHLQGTRHRVREARRAPVRGRGRLQRGQRAGRVVQCHTEARGPHGRTLPGR